MCTGLLNYFINLLDILYETLGLNIMSTGSNLRMDFLNRRCKMKSEKTLSLCFRASVLFMPILLPWNQALAHAEEYGGWHMGPGMMGNWGTGWFGMIFMIVFWVLLVVGLVFLIKWLILSTRSEKSEAGGGRRALEILKERYARGEIDKAEFEEKRKDLT